MLQAGMGIQLVMQQWRNFFDGKTMTGCGHLQMLQLVYWKCTMVWL